VKRPPLHKDDAGAERDAATAIMVEGRADPSMLVEIDPAIYDVQGKPVAGIRRRHRLAQPDLPFGRFFSQPLGHKCASIENVRSFLRTCRYASDQRLFGKEDYWCPPEEFERLRRGDCEDFALWTWRQLLALGYEVRFVGGSAGFYGDGHAWLTVKIGTQHYMLEPQARRSEKLPRLAVLGYHPVFSVEWTGVKAKYYEHQPTKRYETLAPYLKLGPEWLLFRSVRVGRLFGALMRLPGAVAWGMLKRFGRPWSGR
jgi:predicted transglutaminase-like cysteine proteinase